MAVLAAMRARREYITTGDWRSTVSSFAEKVSGGAWKPYRWLVYIEKIIREELAKGGARIILNVPPRHGKSELVSKYLPAWILDQDPTKRVILTSYEADFAAEWGKKVRDLVNNRHDILPLVRPDVSARKHWETMNGGSMISVGVGGAITGRGGDVLVVDDPTKNWEQAYSKTHQLMLQNWFESTLMTRLEPGGSVVVVMTRWSVEDLTAYLKSKTGDRWMIITLPAIAEEDDPLGRSVGEALCPERFPIETLEEIRDFDIGSFKFNAMYQQHPTPLEGGFIRRDWWGFYDTFPTAFDDSILSWDMTFKKTEKGSFVAGGGIGRIGNQFIVFPRLIHKRMDFVQSVVSVSELKAQYPLTNGTLIEDKANGPAIMSQLEDVIDDLIPWSPQGKIAQASAVSPIIEAGNFLLPNPDVFKPASEWVDIWIDEWADFPAGKNDDLVDMGSQGVLKLRERSKHVAFHVGRA